MAELLDGWRILVVEDDFVLSLDLRDMIEGLGGTVVGPVGRLAQGFVLAETEELGGALLDINLGTETSFALADKLLAAGTPIIFATGYEAATLPERFAGILRLSKPFTMVAVEKVFRKLLAGR